MTSLTQNCPWGTAEESGTQLRHFLSQAHTYRGAGEAEGLEKAWLFIHTLPEGPVHMPPLPTEQPLCTFLQMVTLLLFQTQNISLTGFHPKATKDPSACNSTLLSLKTGKTTPSLERELSELQFAQVQRGQATYARPHHLGSPELLDSMFPCSWAL